MATITAFEAKTRFGELLERVAKGEEVVITRHDKPVARIIPEGAASLNQVREAVLRLDRVRQAIHKRTKRQAKLSDSEVRSAINEGRR